MKKKSKIELDKKEREYLSGLIEAQRSNIIMLDERQQKNEIMQNDLKLANRIDKKLMAFS